MKPIYESSKLKTINRSKFYFQVQHSYDCGEGIMKYLNNFFGNLGAQHFYSQIWPNIILTLLDRKDCTLHRAIEVKLP